MIKLIPISNYKLQVQFDYDAKLVTALRNINGSNYDKDTKTNTLIVGKENIDSIRQLVKQYSIVWTEAKEVLMEAKKTSIYRILNDNTALFPYSTEHNGDLKQAGYRWDPETKGWYGGNVDKLQLIWWIEDKPLSTYQLPEIHNTFSPQGIMDELESSGFIADDAFWNRVVQLAAETPLEGFDGDKFIMAISA